LDDLRVVECPVSIVTEFPNLAESFAMKLRMRRFRIFPVWGRAEAYPPENADLALVAEDPDSAATRGLRVVAPVLSTNAWLIANTRSWESRDLSTVLDRFRYPTSTTLTNVTCQQISDLPGLMSRCPSASASDSDVWIALPDGHQQGPTVQFLRDVGVTVNMDVGNPDRPDLNLPGVKIKVIRPQDMPIQVANRSFDLAITGEDWLHDHLCVFPSSPVRKILSLGFGKVRIVAVVSKNLTYETPQDLRSPSRRRNHPVLRIASEYVNVADKYARENHLSPYRVIPTWGASEAFLPEDADLLVENSQTGRTLAQHGLRIIDTLFESSACVIGREQPHGDHVKRTRIDEILTVLAKGIHPGESNKEE